MLESLFQGMLMQFTEQQQENSIKFSWMSHGKSLCQIFCSAKRWMVYVSFATTNSCTENDLSTK